MTIQQVLEALDNQQYNTMSQAAKIKHLSDLDYKVLELYDGFTAGSPGFYGYDENTDLNRTLLIAAPYDGIYLHWLQLQVDLQNREYARFNNSNALFQAAWQAFSDWYLRTHEPKKKGTFH